MEKATDNDKIETGLVGCMVLPPPTITIEGGDWLAIATGIITEGVSNEEELTSAVHVIKGLKEASKSIHDQLQASNDMANKAHRAITGKRSELQAPFGEAEASLRMMTNAYVTKQAIIAREAEAKVRREQEAKAIEAAAKAQTDADLAAKKLREAGEAEAAKMVEKQGSQIADQIVDAATQTMDAAPAPEKPHMPAGSSTSTKWTAEVVDMKAFLIGAADGLHGTQFVTVNQGDLNRFAQKCKGSPASLGMPDIPGVEFRSNENVRV